MLQDPNDEFILELAVAGDADSIVTHNRRHFRNAALFGIQVQTPAEFLRIIRKEDL